MLVNATQPEEVRIAITDGNDLFDLDIENVAEDAEGVATHNPECPIFDKFAHGQQAETQRCEQ